MWNPTDVEAITLEFLSPAGFEGFFEEMGGLAEGAIPDTIPGIAAQYGLTFHPELIAALSASYGVSPQALGSR